MAGGAEPKDAKEWGRRGDPSGGPGEEWRRPKQRSWEGRGGLPGTLGVVAGPRKTGVRGELSHLSRSISTWHLGRASDAEAAYPCGRAGPVPAPSQPRRGHLAGPALQVGNLPVRSGLRLAAPRGPVALSASASPSWNPGCFLRGARAPPCCFVEWIFPVSPGRARLDFGQSAGIC